MKKTVQVLVWLLAATLAATAVAAPRRDSGRKKSGANDAVSEKIAEWVREVKKQEAAPVAEGFVRWTGLDSIKGTKNARWLSPSDLRGRFVVVVDIDAAKAPEQVKATIGIQNLALNPNGHGTDWDFAPVPRDIVVVYNVHDLSDEDLEKFGKIVDDALDAIDAAEDAGAGMGGAGLQRFSPACHLIDIIHIVYPNETDSVRKDIAITIARQGLRRNKH